MILLKKDGDFYRKSDYKASSEYEIIRGSVCPYLNEALEIEPGVTFGQLMIHIFTYDDEYNHVFASHLGHYPIALWKQDFYKEPKNKDNDAYDGMEYLVVTHAAIEINSSGINPFKIDDVSIYDEFHGYGKWSGKDDTGIDAGYYGIEFTSLGELKQYELRLKTDQEFFDLGTYKLICKMERHFTVYEVLSAILYEISWSGDPTQRDEKWTEITDRVDKAKQSIKEGTTKYKDADEFFNDMKRIIDEAKNDELS